MKEFIEKLIGRLEERKNHFGTLVVVGKDDLVLNYNLGKMHSFEDAKRIVNKLAEEYNNDFCEWEYDDFEDSWETSCGTYFSLCDSDREVTNYCPYCGKKIKVVE